MNIKSDMTNKELVRAILMALCPEPTEIEIAEARMFRNCPDELDAQIFIRKQFADLMLREAKYESE